jgi:hypothetical protein
LNNLTPRRKDSRKRFDKARWLVNFFERGMSPAQTPLMITGPVSGPVLSQVQHMWCFRKTILPWSASLLFVALVGCGSGPKVVKVSGILTYKGQPVKDAYIDFVPDKGGRPAVAETDDQGHFEAMYESTKNQKGITAGKNKIVLRPKPKLSTKAEQEAYMRGQKVPMPKERQELFDKYGDKSTKYITVESSTSDLHIDLD